MARKLTANMTLDDLEDEVLYTRAALKADPHAQDFLSLTGGWLGLIDEVRAYDRQVRERAADVDAARMLANEYLDTACVAFGDDLLFAVDKDRSSSRWSQYFSMPVSRFVQQALSRQVEIVKGWLGLPAGADEVLDAHRGELEGYTQRADRAVSDTRNLTPLRGTVWQRREQLVAALTSQRDELRDTLAQRAREKKLSRAWADVFFKVGESGGDKKEEPVATPASSSPPA